MSEHSWCQNIQRDEAVRAAEDGRSGPLPTLQDVIAAVTERRPPEPGGGENVTPAASGAAGTEAVAWMCEWSDHTALYDSLAIAEVDADGDIVPQPLYRSPPTPAPGWLTAEERETLMRISHSLDYVQFFTSAHFIRSLLARSSPPEVVPPEQEFRSHSNALRDAEWFAALAAAGVTCKEVGRE